MAENKKYDPQDFIKSLGKHTNGRSIPACPFCGSRNYTSTDSIATILINTEITGINIGPTIPSGILVCTQCGHIELFALGALGLLETKDGQNDADKNESKK